MTYLEILTGIVTAIVVVHNLVRLFSSRTHTVIVQRHLLTGRMLTSSGLWNPLLSNRNFPRSYLTRSGN